MRDQPSLDDAGAQAVTKRHMYRAKMTEFLDNKISQTIASLEATGKLENTYVVVTSDNGWMEGEHRLPMGKAFPYEESTHVPLWVSGPGITPGTVINEPTSNIDLFATFEDIAGQDPDLRDGLSLLPRLHNKGSIDRQRVLIEEVNGRSSDYNAIFDVSHEGRKLKYVEYVDGAKELYDLDVDPYELQSLHETADSALLADLSEDLATIKNCSGDTCRTESSNP